MRSGLSKCQAGGIPIYYTEPTEGGVWQPMKAAIAGVCVQTVYKIYISSITFISHMVPDIQGLGANLFGTATFSLLWVISMCLSSFPCP